MASRLKERGGGGGKVMASKPQKVPIDDTPKTKSLNRRTPIAAAATGKENSAASRRNPAIVPGVRWSTSSLPRGKSPKPLDLNPSKELAPRGRVLGKDANLKPNLARRSSLDVNLGKDRKIEIFSKVSKDLAPKATEEKTSGKISRSFELKACNVVKVSEKSSKEDAASKKIPISSDVEVKNLDCSKVVDIPSENGIRAVSKYPSKLHEKLAALEGRVQRIASDIKKTKEMLDSNNKQAESKLILSDIQKKISGIENAVSSVMDGDGIGVGMLEIVKESSLRDEIVTAQNSNGKGLNLEELEARFFPHQKLIKNRMGLDSKPDLSKRKGSMSPIDENPIAVEFLASLSTDQHDKTKDGIVREMGSDNTTSRAGFESKKVAGLQCNEEIEFMEIEKLDELDDQQNKMGMMLLEDSEDSFNSQMFEIGCKSSTGGWFVSEGEAALLTHNDGSCSYYDIANSEEKSEFQPPERVSNNLWGDCWLIRAPGIDGCSGRFVVAASAGNSLESGFCSWDFYTKNIQAFHVEDGTQKLSVASSRTALAPLTNTGVFGRNASCTMPLVDSQQWWYRPCGPLLISTASKQKKVSAYDIRDGELVMTWNVNSSVVGMEYSSPLQWRSKGKVILAETEAVSLWDVNSRTPQPLLSISSSGKAIHCLHVNNTDAEVGGGVRQRARSSEVEGNDGVFCTQDSVNVLDFRLPSGVGLKSSRHGANAHSIFSCGDSIFIGSSETRLRNGPRSHVQQFSLRKGKLAATYDLPDSNSHAHHSSITQVWGNSNFVMGITGRGLFVYDTYRDASLHSLSSDRGKTVEVRETIGPDDLYSPTFDYLGSRVLLISRDRPAMWRYLL